MIVGMPSIACCCDPPGPPPPGDCSYLDGTCEWNTNIAAVRVNISNFRKVYTIINPLYCLTIVTEWDYSVVLKRVGRAIVSSQFGLSFFSIGSAPVKYADFPRLAWTGPNSGDPCFNQPEEPFRVGDLYNPCAGDDDYPRVPPGVNGVSANTIGSDFASDFGLPEMTVQWTESTSQSPCNPINKSKTFASTQTPRVTGTATRTLTNRQTNEQFIDTVSVNCPLWAHMTCGLGEILPNPCEVDPWMHLRLTWLHPENSYNYANSLFEGDPFNYQDALDESRIVFPPLAVPMTTLNNNGTTFFPGFQEGAFSGNGQRTDRMSFAVPEQTFPNGLRLTLFRCNTNSSSSPCRFPWGTTGCIGDPCTNFPAENGFNRPCGYPGFALNSWTCYSEPQMEMEIVEPS